MEGHWSIKILYDGACPLCSAEMQFLKRRDKKNKILLQDISKLDLQASHLGKSIEELNRFIHAELPNGKIIRGMDVFREAYSAVGLGYLLWPTKLPIIKQLADLGYFIFARYRIKISALFGRRASESCILREDK